MSLLFRKSFKLSKHVRLNILKRDVMNKKNIPSIGVNIGTPALRIGVNSKRGVYVSSSLLSKIGLFAVKFFK